MNLSGFFAILLVAVVAFVQAAPTELQKESAVPVPVEKTSVQTTQHDHHGHDHHDHDHASHEHESHEDGGEHEPAETNSQPQVIAVGDLQDKPQANIDPTNEEDGTETPEEKAEDAVERAKRQYYDHSHCYHDHCHDYYSDGHSHTRWGGWGGYRRWWG